MRVRPSHSFIFLSAIAINFAILLSPFWTAHFDFEIGKQNIAAETGHAFITRITTTAHFPLELVTDALGAPQVSSLALSESGTLLGPAHSLHDEIRIEGRGRYSHWNGYLYFSTSDNSDPRTNGRQYVASGKMRLWPSIWIGAALADFVLLIFVRRQLAALLHRRGKLLILIFAGAAVVSAGFLAIGVFGVINPTGAPAKEARFVFEIVGTIALVCFITIAQWVMGAGLARALLPKSGSSYAEILLLGFPLSLVTIAVLAVIILALPFGWSFAVGLWMLSIWPLIKWPLDRLAMRKIIAVLPGYLVLSMALGCWMALMWHGPTASIPGLPSVDMVQYASTPWAISAYPIRTPYLSFEGGILRLCQSTFSNDSGNAGSAAAT